MLRTESVDARALLNVTERVCVGRPRRVNPPTCRRKNLRIVVSETEQPKPFSTSTCVRSLSPQRRAVSAYFCNSR